MRDWHAGMWKKDKSKTLKCDKRKERMRKDDEIRNFGFY